MRTAITIILNGRHHLERQYRFIQDNFDKWIVIEGASKSSYCTSWCKQMPAKYHDNGASIDGTRELLKSIKTPNMDIYYAEGMWDGKLTMLNTGLDNSDPDDGYLWEIDIDEYWTEDKLDKSEQLLDNTTGSVAAFVCDYLLSDNIVVRGPWGEGLGLGYKRLWKYKKGQRFISHEPPFIRRDEITISPMVFPRFKHLSYYYEQDVKFKSEWYSGHEHVYDGWREIVGGKIRLPCSVTALFKKNLPNPQWNKSIITII